MTFIVEILATSDELYIDIEQAIQVLNKVQDDFQYQTPSASYKDHLYVNQSTNYQSETVFSLLSDYKNIAKGHRPFTVAVVDGNLQSNKLANLFGTISAKKGVAVFTTKNFDQFVHDRIRYLRYYLVRYSLSFVHPGIKSHDEDLRKTCVFHKKMNKAEIKDSLDSGEICGVCFEQLSSKLTLDIRRSIEALLKVVSNQFPYALILKGGGVKGLAFAGALMEMEQHFSFDTFVGTSAGAIASLLLGAGYSPLELLTILSKKDFNDFKDAKIWEIPFNLLSTRSIFPGKTIEVWLNQLLKEKFPQKLTKVELQNLPHHTIIYASRKGDGTFPFDSRGVRKDSSAAFSARCSMAIPYYFSPKFVDGTRVYDGGITNNFPLKTFLDGYPQKPFLGMFLISDEKEKASMLSELANIVVQGEEAKTVEQNLDKVVVIDTRPIRTLDFNLCDKKKLFLINAGRLGALKFLNQYHPDFGQKVSKISELESELESLKKDF